MKSKYKKMKKGLLYEMIDECVLEKEPHEVNTISEFFNDLFSAETTELKESEERYIWFKGNTYALRKLTEDEAIKR